MLFAAVFGVPGVRPMGGSTGYGFATCSPSIVMENL
jgi:hypothetical protein